MTRQCTSSWFVKCTRHTPKYVDVAMHHNTMQFIYVAIKRVQPGIRPSQHVAKLQNEMHKDVVTPATAATQPKEPKYVIIRGRRMLESCRKPSTIVSAGKARARTSGPPQAFMVLYVVSMGFCDAHLALGNGLGICPKLSSCTPL